MKTVTINGKDYYARRHPQGYGYQIMEKTPIPNEDGGESIRATYKCLFHSDKELVERYFYQFENGNIVTNFPPPLPIVCPEKIVVHRTKHYEAYYSVPTFEALEATFRHILVQEYTGQIEHMKPENQVVNDSGVTSLEEVESIPIEAVREEVRRKWKKYVNEVKENARYTKDWMNLKAVLEGKGNAFNAMEAFEHDRYEFDELITIK